MINQSDLSNDQNLQVWVSSGLLDLMVGLIILGFGLGIVSDAVWMGGILLPVMLPSLMAAHKSFASRLPPTIQVPPGSGRKLTWLGVVLVGVLSLAAGIAFFLIFEIDQPVVSSLRTWLSNHMTLAMSLLWTLLFASAGWVIRRTRYALYAGAALLTGIAAQYLNLPFWLAPIVTGGLVLLVGIGTTVSFLQTHPVTMSPKDKEF